MTPISSAEFHSLISPLVPLDAPILIAVAVSGGADSLALALLAHRWANDIGGKAIGLTVDHRLRDASTAEALQVKVWLERLGMEHHILTWEGHKPKTAIQAIARKARYHLLEKWCQGQGVRYLLTAHHAQDQLETFLIRLSKGSGLKGLTGIQGKVQKDFGCILRPLLTVHPDRLKATLKDHPFIIDPSNENPDFTRVRWRRLLPDLAKEGLTVEGFQETLGRLTHSQRLIEGYVKGLLDRYVTISPYGYAVITQEIFDESEAALEEIFKRVLAIIGVQDYPVRRHALHDAIQRIKDRQDITLGGCQIIGKAKNIWVVREAAALGKDVEVNGPGSYRWDGRFIVEVLEEVPCRISALGEVGMKKLERRPDIPSIVMKTLPALWCKDEVILSLPPFTFMPREVMI